MGRKGCLLLPLLALAAVVVTVRWWTSPIDYPQPKRPAEPANNPYEVYRSLAHYSAQLFRNDVLLAEAERAVIPTPLQLRRERSDLVYYLLLKTYPFRAEYRQHLHKPCAAILEYTPRWISAELREFRRWAYLEALQIAEASAKGEYDKAVDSFRTILLLSEQIQSQGKLAHRLTANHMQATVSYQMAQVISRLPEPSCRQVVQVVRQWHQRRIPLAENLRVERDALISLLHYIQQSEPEAIQLLWQSELPLAWHPRWLNLRQAAREADRYYRQAAHEVSKPLIYQQPVEMPAHPVARTMVVVLAPLARVDATSTARLRMIGCVAAVRAYRLRYGQYPPDLRTAGVADLNRDPFTGKEFHYKRSQRGFLLYSVGADGRDDGGWRSAEQGGTKGDLSILPYRPAPLGRSALAKPLWIR